MRADRSFGFTDRQLRWWHWERSRFSATTTAELYASKPNDAQHHAATTNDEPNDDEPDVQSNDDGYADADEPSSAIHTSRLGELLPTARTGQKMMCEIRLRCNFS